jgi:hypothetical protein
VASYAKAERQRRKFWGNEFTVGINDSLAKSLGNLWGQATGGSAVAAAPSSVSDWPTAARPAGMDTALQWFKDGFVSSAVPRMLFLVGGPGAGKSHAAAQLVAGLTETAPLEDGLAHRTYLYETAGRPLVVINDATIVEPQKAGGSLAEDIRRCMDDHSHLFACVNRGILVEELAHAKNHHAAADGPILDILDWLIEGNANTSSAFDGWQLERVSQNSFLRSSNVLRSGELVAQAVVVFVDVCSLFEVAPNIQVAQSGDQTAIMTSQLYQICRFRDRASLDSSALPAGELFGRVLETLKPDVTAVDADYSDPISANITSLSKPALLNGLLSVLRASEIVASQRMTYREVWGVLCRSVVGDLPSRVPASDVQAEVLRRQPQSNEPISRFAEFKELAALRYSQAVYGAGSSVDLSDSALRDPVTRFTHPVDPVRDAIPGKNGDSNRGWSTPISDAFAGQVAEGTPLDGLLGNIDVADPFRDAVTDFDRALDQAFAAATASSSMTPNGRYSAIVWYGGYLMRLYATANGIPAFRAEVEIWTGAWALSPKIPDLLEKQLLTLLKPARVEGASDGASLIPLFASRTNPITGDSSPQLALRTATIEISTERESDSLLLRLTEGNKKIRAILFDFPLVREAMACGEGRSGVTELSDATAPRLERFRAARLVPGKRMDTQRYRMVRGLGDEVLSVGETL